MRYAALLGAVVLAILVWTGYWFFVAGEAVAAFETWAQQRRAMGTSVAYEDPTVSGYPFRIRIEVPGIEIGLPAHPLKPLLRTGALKAIGQPWNLNHILVELEGSHDFSFALGKIRHTAQVTLETGIASIKLGDDGRISRLSLDLGNASFLMADTILADTERLQIHLRPGQRADTLFELAIEMGRSHFASRQPMPLGNEIAAFDLQLSFQGSFKSLPPGSNPVVYWRDQGGTIEVTKLHLAWGPVITDVKGTLSLDEQMRPLGATTARITGYDVLVDLARAQGQLTDEGANAAKVALGLLAVAGGGRLSVPLNMQDGHLFLGPVKLARLAPVLALPKE